MEHIIVDKRTEGFENDLELHTRDKVWVLYMPALKSAVGVPFQGEPFERLVCFHSRESAVEHMALIPEEEERLVIEPKEVDRRMFLDICDAGNLNFAYFASYEFAELYQSGGRIGRVVADTFLN